MTPPSVRLDTLEKRLLDAARREGPRESARRRTVIAIAGGAAIGTATASSAAAAAIGSAGGGTGAATAALGGAKVTTGVALIGLAKAVAIGAVSGVVVLGAAQKIQAPRATVSPPATAVAVTPTRRAPTPDRVAPPTRETDVPAPLPGEAPAMDVRPPSNAPVARSTPTPAELPRVLPPASAPSEGAGDTASLLEEVAFLDRAREALLAGDPRRALAALDAYERARVGTRLAAEATLLRIEGLLANGERARAAGLAEAFLRAHPETPVADRMRAIIHAASH